MFLTNSPQPIFRQLTWHWSTDRRLGAPHPSPLPVLESCIQNPTGDTWMWLMTDEGIAPQQAGLVWTPVSSCFLCQEPAFRSFLQHFSHGENGSPTALLYFSFEHRHEVRVGFCFVFSCMRLDVCSDWITEQPHLRIFFSKYKFQFPRRCSSF